MRLATLAFAALLAMPNAQAALVSANWGLGTLGTINITTSNFISSGTFNVDLSSTNSNFDAAPLSATEHTLAYAGNSAWTINFSSPVQNLLLYLGFWRGTLSGSPNSTTSYTFNSAFTILDGLGGATVSGNTLKVANTGFASGILKFTSPIS